MFAGLKYVYSSDLLLAEYPAFKITVEQAQTSISEDEDGSCLPVQVKNMLPCVSLD
jgi:hypothetical protein